MSESLSADVIVKFKFTNICGTQDLIDCGMSLKEMVEMLFEEEGLMGCVEDDYEVVSVASSDES